MRLTKIICTLGPSSKTPEDLAALVASGMNIARINLSHGTKEEHRTMIRAVRALADRGHCVATMIDTKGAEIRTGDVKEALVIEEGQEVLFSPHEVRGEGRPVIHVNDDGFAMDVREANRILVDNGELSFDVVSVRDDDVVVARAREPGKIGSRRHINLPGADVQLPSVTKNDWEDIALGIEEGVDIVALSFVRSAGAVREVKTFLRENSSQMLVVAKIETQKAVESIDDIVDAADGIMVARGDLGAEIPFERVPAIQDTIVRSCREAGKPVIVATHMLESMIEHPIPTRAEVTDVAHAAMSRTDCTMLSAETAMGRHPILALQAMDRILRETESHLPVTIPGQDGHAVNEQAARAEAAVTMAVAMRAAAIIVLTKTSRSAQLVSQYRPPVPVVALTDTAEVQRQMQLLYGVIPLTIAFSENPETTVVTALKTVSDRRLLESGQQVVLVSDTKTNVGAVPAVQARMIP